MDEDLGVEKEESLGGLLSDFLTAIEVNLGLIGGSLDTSTEIVSLMSFSGKNLLEMREVLHDLSEEVFDDGTSDLDFDPVFDTLYASSNLSDLFGDLVSAVLNAEPVDSTDASLYEDDSMEVEAAQVPVFDTSRPPISFLYLMGIVNREVERGKLPKDAEVDYG